MSYSILIADDEAEILNLLRLYLENEHYNIIEAADGQQALDALQSHHIDLCILDIMMPKVDGFHVLQEMRQKSNIPVRFRKDPGVESGCGRLSGKTV